MKNATSLSLRIPTPKARPGDPADLSHVNPPPAGETPRPDVSASAHDMRDMAFKLVRVLNDAGEAVGPWNPALDAQTLRRGLRVMLLTRAFDDRMYRMQRQGKTSFYMKSTGEEAIPTAAALALEKDDMCFTSYRQQAILFARDYPLVTMMNQIYSNAADPNRGRQMPVHYSAKQYGFFSISGNLATQVPQAVGWAMASAYKKDNRIACTFVGDGATAEGDFHQAMTFASVYHAPVIINVVNNQWAISSFQGIAGGDETTFAARAIGYGVPPLRVDGNDFLAVYGAIAWAAERARTNMGPTLIEHYTYRVEGHSTSDDPTRYRPAEEPRRWPLGDPVERLKQHLIVIGEWSDARHKALEKEVAEEVKTAAKEAEAIGTLGQSRPSVKEMFEDVYKEQPWHLRRQRQELGT
ncbi:MAG: 3-methyl-2-oxobutanoate dehydrogenase (2-methylpropanoyl-transferring) subunit alpha [Hyphomonadaceae bacterium]|nr:3-methyl-2-oxobutanoate dehydrogenase (2-methylpropanoyl-transferring) subunit alpha [Hyphomonadaceae bacterium]